MRTACRFWLCAAFAAINLLHAAVAAPAIHHITVGFGANKPPYIFEDSKSGLELELVTAAFRAAGITVTPYFAPHDRLFSMLTHHHIQAVAMANKASKIPAFYSDSHIVYQNYAIALASRQDITIKNIADLGKYRVTSFQGARNMLGPAYRNAVDHSPNYSEQPQPSQRNTMLYHRRVDVVIADKRVFEYFREHAGPEVDQSQPVRYFAVFPPTHYQVGFDQQEDRDRFNQGLALIHKNGTYDAIMRRYTNP